MAGRNPSGIRMTDLTAWLPDLGRSELFLIFTLEPVSPRGRAQASLELCLWLGESRSAMVRRWGEQVSLTSEQQIVGAWYRAAIAASTWFEDKDVGEVERLAKWNTSAKQTA